MSDNTTPKLEAQIREACRVRHYSLATERAYVHWYRRFVRWAGLKHPATLGGDRVQAWLSHLATERDVSASTQRQAPSAQAARCGACFTPRFTPSSARRDCSVIASRNSGSGVVVSGGWRGHTGARRDSSSRAARHAVFCALDSLNAPMAPAPPCRCGLARAARLLRPGRRALRPAWL